MAKVKIQGHASGTGVLTVTAPNTSTDRTITLPDSTGTLATTADSVGGATGVDFNDNVKARFGTGNDLEIYHSGGHSFIHDTGTGDLQLRGTDVRIKSDSDNDDMATFIENGAASLFHSNSKKLETTATGITVTGAIAGATNLGKVLQVIQATSNTATYPTTGWTNIASSQISITPSATSSKILYMYSAGGFVSGTNLNSCGLRIKRSIGGATAQDLRECSRWGYFTNAGHAPINPSMTYLDSPNTTSACSFYMEALEENGGSYEINDTSQTNGAVVIVMEIAG